MKLPQVVSILTCSVLLCACSLIPEYNRPPSPVTANWPDGAAYSKSAGAGSKMAPDVAWRDFFKDPGLRKVIALALANNRDLRQAALDVQAYRALHRIQNAKLLPSLGVGASATMERVPGDVAITGIPGAQNQYEVALGMSAYEVDFFGKIRSLSDVALETYLASDEARRSEQIALVGEVANAYLTWRTDQSLSTLTDQTLESNEKSLKLIEQNVQSGITSQLAVRQARVAVDHARTQRAADTRQVAQDLNALQFLVGTQLPVGLSPSDDLMNSVMFNLPVGLSSHVLLKRPDIAAAEHRLLASNADIGAARAAFFPSISLTASAGTISGRLQDLFSPGQGIWTFAPQINVPIFTGGALKANLDYVKIQKDISVADYEKTIQNAFREVADGLAARSTYVDQLQSQSDLVENNQEYLALAQERFHQGITTYLVVLDAQRELFSSRQQLLRDRMAQLITEISLYKALGGGTDDQISAIASVK